MRQIILSSLVLLFSISSFASSDIRQNFADEMNSIAKGVHDISLADLDSSPGPVLEVSSLGSARYLDFRNGEPIVCTVSQPQTEGDGILRKIFLKGKSAQVIAGLPFLRGDLCWTMEDEKFELMYEKISREQHKIIVDGMSFLASSYNLQQIVDRLSSRPALSGTGVRLNRHKPSKISYMSATQKYMQYQLNFSLLTFTTTNKLFLADCSLQVRVQLDEARNFTGIQFPPSGFGCGNLPYY